MKSDIFRVLILFICVTETLAWIRFRHPPSRRNFVQQTPLETLQKCDITKDAFCKICGEGNASTSDIPVTNYTIIDRNTRILAIEVAFQVGLDGYLEFRLCNVTENATMDAIVCRDITPLLIGASERWYPNPDQTYAQSRLRLPAELECVRCVLQVKYTPGDQSIMKNLRFYDCALLNISRPNMDITNFITTRTVVTNTNVNFVPGQVINTGNVNRQASGQVINTGTVNSQASGQVINTGTVNRQASGQVINTGTVNRQASGLVINSGAVNDQATNTTTVTNNVINVSTQGATKSVRPLPSDHAILEEEQMFSHDNVVNGNGKFVQNNERRQFGHFGFKSGTGVVPTREAGQGSDVNLRHSLTEANVVSGRDAPVVGLISGEGLVHRFSTITDTVSDSGAGTNTASVQTGGVVTNTVNTASSNQIQGVEFSRGGKDNTVNTIEGVLVAGDNNGVRVVTNLEKMNVLTIGVNDGAVNENIANNAGNVVNTIGGTVMSNSNLQTGSSGAVNQGLTTKTRDTLNVLSIDFVSDNAGMVRDNIANNGAATVVNTIDRTDFSTSNQQGGVAGVLNEQTTNNRGTNVVNVVNRIDRTVITGSGQQGGVVTEGSTGASVVNEITGGFNGDVVGVSGVTGQGVAINTREKSGSVLTSDLQQTGLPAGVVNATPTVVRTTNTGNVKFGTVGVVNNDLAFTEVNNAANWDNAALSSDQTSRIDSTRSESAALLLDNTNAQTTGDINSEMQTNIVSTNQAEGETVNNNGIVINRTFVDTTWNEVPVTTGATVRTVDGDRITNNVDVVNTIERTNIITGLSGHTLIRNNTSQTSLFGLSMDNNIGIRNTTGYNENMIHYNNTLYGFNETSGTNNNDMNSNGTDIVFNTQETLINTNAASAINIENPVETIEGSSIYLGDISSLNSGGNTVDPTVRTVTVSGIVTDGVNKLSNETQFGIIVNTNKVNAEVLTRDTTPVIDEYVNTVILNRTVVSADVSENKVVNDMNVVNTLELNNVNIGVLGNNMNENRFETVTNEISGFTDGTIVGNRETIVRKVNVPSIATGTNSVIGETVNDNSAVIINRTFVDTSLDGGQNTGMNFINENRMTHLNVVNTLEHNNMNVGVLDNSVSTGNTNVFTNENRFGVVTNTNSGLIDGATVGNNQINTVREAVVREVNLPPIVPSMSDLAVTSVSNATKTLVSTHKDVVGQTNIPNIDTRGINIDINMRRTNNAVVTNIASAGTTDGGLQQQVITVPDKLSVFPIPLIPERNETKLVASSNKFIVRRQNIHDTDTVNTGQEFGIGANYSDGSITQGASISTNRLIQLDSNSNNVVSSNTGPVTLIHTLTQQSQDPSVGVSNINKNTNEIVLTQSQKDSSSTILTLDNTFNINQNVGFEFPAGGDVSNYLGQTTQTAAPIVTQSTDISQRGNSLNILNLDNNLAINQDVGKTTVISTPTVNQRTDTTVNVLSGTETPITIRPINDVMVTNMEETSIHGSSVQTGTAMDTVRQGAANGVVKTVVTTVTDKRVDMPVSEISSVQLAHDVTNRLSDSHTNVNTMFGGHNFFTDGNDVDKFGGVPIAITGRDETVLLTTGDMNRQTSGLTTLTNSKQTWSASDTNIGNSFDSTNALGVVVLDSNMDNSAVGHGVVDRNVGHLSTDQLSVINTNQIIKTSDELVRPVDNIVTTTLIKPTLRPTTAPKIGNNVVWQVMDVGTNENRRTINGQGVQGETQSARLAKDHLEMMVNGDATLNNIHTKRTISTKAIQSLEGVPDVMPPINVKVQASRTTNVIRNNNNILRNTKQASSNLNNNGGSYIINNLLHRTDDNSMNAKNAKTLTGSAQLTGSTLWDINRNKTDIVNDGRTVSTTTVLRKTSSNDGTMSTSVDRKSNNWSVQQSNGDQIPNYRTVIYDKPRVHMTGPSQGNEVNSQVVRTLQALNLELSAIEGNIDNRNEATMVDRTNVETTNINTGASNVNNRMGIIGIDGSIETSNNVVGRLTSNGNTLIGGGNKDITLNINTGTHNEGRVVGIDGSIVTSNELVGRVTSNGNTLSGGANKVKTTNVHADVSKVNDGTNTIGLDGTVVSSNKIIGRVTSNGQASLSRTNVVDNPNVNSGTATTIIGREVNTGIEGPIVRPNTVIGSGTSTVTNNNAHSSFPLFRVHETMLRVPQHVRGSIERVGSFGLGGGSGQRGANNHMIIDDALAIRNNRLNTETNNAITHMQNMGNGRITNTVTVNRNDNIVATNNLNTAIDNTNQLVGVVTNQAVDRNNNVATKNNINTAIGSTNQHIGVITNQAVETRYDTAAVNDQTNRNIQTTNIKRLGLGIHDISIPRTSEGVFQSVINVTRPRHDTADLFGSLANAFANVSKQTSHSVRGGTVNTGQSTTVAGTLNLAGATDTNVDVGSSQLSGNNVQQTVIGINAPVVNQAVAMSAPLTNSPWSGSSIDLSHHNDTFLPRGSTRFENRIGLQHTSGNEQIGLRPEMRQFQITNETPTANNVAIEGKYFIGQMRRNEQGQFEPVYTATSMDTNTASVTDRKVKILNATVEKTSNAAVVANTGANRTVVADRKVIILNATVKTPSAINRGNVDVNRAVVSTRKVKILNATVETPSDTAVRMTNVGVNRATVVTANTRGNVDANRAVVSTRKVKILNATEETPSNAAVQMANIGGNRGVVAAVTGKRKVKILNATVETPLAGLGSTLVVGNNIVASNKFDASSNKIGLSNKVDTSSTNIGSSNKFDISLNNIGTSNKFGLSSNSIGTSNKIDAAANNINPIVRTKQAVDTNIVRVVSGEKRTSMGTGSPATKHVFFNQADLLNTFGIDVNIGNEQRDATLTQEVSSSFVPALHNETDGEIISVSCPGDTIYVCEAVGENKQVPGMVWWCYSHCKNGLCPFDKCSCRCVNSDSARKLEQERIERETFTPSDSVIKNKRQKTVVTLTLNGSEKTTVPVEKSETRATNSKVIVPLRDSGVTGHRLILNNGENVASGNRLNGNVQLTTNNNLANNNNIVSSRQGTFSVRTTQQGEAPLEVSGGNTVVRKSTTIVVDDTIQGGLMPRAPIFGSGSTSSDTQHMATETRLVPENTVVTGDRSTKVYTLVCKGINAFVDTPGIADWCAAMCTDAVCPMDICSCS